MRRTEIVRQGNYVIATSGHATGFKESFPEDYYCLVAKVCGCRPVLGGAICEGDDDSTGQPVEASKVTEEHAGGDLCGDDICFKPTSEYFALAAANGLTILER